MNRDVMRIVDRYLHRYLTTSFQLDYQEKFGRWWHHQKQYFMSDQGMPIAIYRKYYSNIGRKHRNGKWSNDSIYLFKSQQYGLSKFRARLPENY